MAGKARTVVTVEQAHQLSQWIGCCRYIWNWGVATQQSAWTSTGKKRTSTELSRALTELRKDPERPWLSEVPRACLEQVLRFQDTAWSRFFKGLKGPPDASGRRPGKPQFHAKSGRDAVRIPLDSRRVEHLLDPAGHRIHLTGLGWVSCRVSEPWLGHISAVTVKRRAGKWFAVLTAVQVPEKQNRPQRAAKLVHFDDAQDPTGIVALDVGVATRATCSDGTVLAHPRESKKKLQRRLRHERRYARQRDAQMKQMNLNPKKPIPKGTRIPVSNRARRTLDRVAAMDLKALFSRNDAIHRFTTDLVQRFHTIIVETLALHAMARSLNRGFRRSMHASAMGEIVRQLEYKCALYGRTLLKVDRWFPSSKKCSTTGCGFVNRKLRLSTREWVCPNCGAHHDRDRNAAVNLWHEGVRLMGLPSAAQSCPTAGSAGREGRGAVPPPGPGKPVWGGVRAEAASFSQAPGGATQALANGMEPFARAVG